MVLDVSFLLLLVTRCEAAESTKLSAQAGKLSFA